MKVVLAVHGTRGDVEPVTAVGRELLTRGHDVFMAVPPNLIGFVESAGLTGVAYGPDSDEQINALAAFVRNLTNARNPLNLMAAGKALFVDGWAEMGRTMTGLADGADLLTTGVACHGAVANVAERQNIPLATLHQFPLQVNGQTNVPSLPTPALVTRSVSKAAWRLYSYASSDADRAQRKELGLPMTRTPARQRMAHDGVPEIQAYDHVLFPGLAAEWGDQRPFVGAMSLELHGEPNEQLDSWIAGGTPPIYFGFGSTPVQSPTETIAMISDVCAELGERALIYSPRSDPNAHHEDHLKLIGMVNYAAVLPKCRAVVHHGGAGTTAAGLRAGMPTLILWDVADQPIWAGAVQHLKVGSGKRLAHVSRKSLLRELRKILKPDYAARALAISARLTKPAAAVAAAADLLEATARRAG